MEKWNLFCCICWTKTHSAVTITYSPVLVSGVFVPGIGSNNQERKIPGSINTRGQIQLKFWISKTKLTNQQQNITYASMRTSGSDRLAEMRSVASRLNWLIMNFSFISTWRSSAMTTGRPISPGASGLRGFSTARHHTTSSSNGTRSTIKER